MKKSILTLSLLLAFSQSAFAKTVLAEDKKELVLPTILQPKHSSVPISEILRHQRKGPTIQIAILLDTSGSMSGLIEQAKSQIYDIIIETSKANKDNKSAYIEVALFEYGKSTVPAHQGHVKMLSPFTGDFDKLSLELFNLQTNGGEEYAGRAIMESASKLRWSRHKDDLKIILIAGNESFSQGFTRYDDAINYAKDKSIIVNTMFCGDYEKGKYLEWENGALLSGGAYLNINHNDAVEHIESPYDDEINQLGYALNKTYRSYRAEGKQTQEMLDSVSGDKSKAALTSRNLAKASKSYDSKSWDMVGLFSNSKEEALIVAKKSEEFKELSEEDIQKKLAESLEERKKIQEKINNLKLKREEYVKGIKSAKNKDTFGNKLISEIREKAIEKGYSFQDK